MGVGSQRRELEALEVGGFSDYWQMLREELPDLVLFANIGLSQLVSADLSLVHRLVTVLKADALVVHTNPLQEALQSEGTPQFRGGIQALTRACREPPESRGAKGNGLRIFRSDVGKATRRWTCRYRCERLGWHPLGAVGRGESAGAFPLSKGGSYVCRLGRVYGSLRSKRGGEVARGRGLGVRWG